MRMTKTLFLVCVIGTHFYAQAQTDSSSWKHPRERLQEIQRDTKKFIIQKLAELSQEELDDQLKEVLLAEWEAYRDNWPITRGQIMTLVRLGANPDSKQRGHDICALERAVLYNDFDLVKFLFEHGASAPTYFSFIPSYSTDKKIIEELCKHGDPNTFIDLRQIMGKKNDPDGTLTEMLVNDQKMDVNKEEACGFTPLLSLANYCGGYSEDEIEIMEKKAKLLIKAGANIRACVKTAGYAGMNAVALASDHAQRTSEKEDCNACAAFSAFLVSHMGEPTKN